MFTVINVKSISITLIITFMQILIFFVFTNLNLLTGCNHNLKKFVFLKKSTL